MRNSSALRTIIWGLWTVVSRPHLCDPWMRSKDIVAAFMLCTTTRAASTLAPCATFCDEVNIESSDDCQCRENNICGSYTCSEAKRQLRMQKLLHLMTVLVSHYLLAFGIVHSIHMSDQEPPPHYKACSRRQPAINQTYSQVFGLGFTLVQFVVFRICYNVLYLLKVEEVKHAGTAAAHRYAKTEGSEVTSPRIEKVTLLASINLSYTPSMHR
ncbi:hypothetical protein GN958_ATG07084 [Phytophthora infestans]|uniref:Transmembrane protein n=1 Tax=Phytophthora infestans TaxID=4787 RepID=A0A8S9UXJ1_PHYIN|nr:hypothetical protein GN958_ATG22327 [Phytophthora infestans]KAF4143719.1 hypothetical protein GN958_ATG07084 [Phytophthora infestans]